MAAKNYDFSGWATVNDLLCADGGYSPRRV